MDDRPETVREPARVERETTVINTGRSGGGNALLALVLLLAVAVTAFLVFGGAFRGGGKNDIDVNVKVPEVAKDIVKPASNP